LRDNVGTDQRLMLLLAATDDSFISFFHSAVSHKVGHSPSIYCMWGGRGANVWLPSASLYGH